MSYTQAEIRKLIDGTLTDSQLKELCHDRFPSVYADFDSKCRSDKIIILTNYVLKQVKVDDLLEQIEHINPKGYNRIINPLNILEICTFDLTSTIENCVQGCSDKIYDERGLICLSLSCSNDKLFVDSFCERLKQELSKQGDVFKNDLMIVSNNKANKITRIGKQIGLKYEKLTSDNIGIFPVDISACNRPQDITNFLKDIQTSFESRRDFCSIIIMFGKDHFSYPENIIRLDLRNWINILTKALGKYGGKEWQKEWQEVGKSWLNIAMKKLSSEENNKDSTLEIDLIYNHLEVMLDVVKKTPGMNPQDFLIKVEEDLKELTE
jgi:hypothetical protein